VSHPPAAEPPVVAAVPAVPPTQPARAIDERGAEWIRLGTWNLRGLGAGGDRDYAAIAAAIDGNFDILTLTEIAHADSGHPGYDRLQKALGDAWGGFVSDGPGADVASSGAEHYAIVYRRDRVRPCSGWHRLRYAADRDVRQRDSGASRFRREPAFSCFETGDPPIGFVVAAYRATSAEDADDIAAEIAHIDDVFAAMSQARPGLRDLIIAGQFHLEAAEIETVTSADVRTRGGGAALNLLGEPTQSLRDHVLVRNADTTTESTSDSSVLDVRNAAASPREFRRSVSDHLPVMLRFRVSAPEAD
jgi:hypothetical protein